MKSEPRFSGFLDYPDFAFNPVNLVNHANHGSDILRISFIAWKKSIGNDHHAVS
jgi:hypothetical protein